MLYYVSFFYVSLDAAKKEEKANKKVQVRWSGYAFPEHDNFRYEQSAIFEKSRPGVKVKYEPVPGDFTSKILTQLVAGTSQTYFLFLPRVL
ncbi:MAG: hypothetical protein HY559_01090 [Gammaproteobacteria bacterium]|nr:hypothetical protein [Gammaproteobacteria bacterium]